MDGKQIEQHVDLWFSKNAPQLNILTNELLKVKEYFKNDLVQAQNLQADIAKRDQRIKDLEDEMAELKKTIKELEKKSTAAVPDNKKQVTITEVASKE